ncbi:hypothetical protein EDM80_13055 [bacterium]|nr:MAG: hypothetical protein EDM80_13055 [bacterium]RIK63094.1 MAG: hypothetical protein DCC64_08495 [Planctomycetota bacterium]
MARRTLKWSPFLALIAALAMLSLAPGCGGTAETLAKEDEGLTVIRRGEDEDPKSMDPHKTGDVISSRHAGMTYECLLQYDYLERPAVLVPALAAAMPQYDRATNTYTFKLRDDVYFSDDRCFHPDARGKTYAQEGEGMQDVRGKGRKLTAADMVYSFKRLAALPDSEGFWVIEKKVQGLDAFHNGIIGLKGKSEGNDPDAEWHRAMEQPVAGLKAPDDLTFQVTLTEPYPQFLYAITLTYGAAVAREAAEYYDKDLSRKPVGTGPYLLKRWRFNSELVYERNPNFRDERFPTSAKPEHARFKPYMGRRLPIADRVIFRVIKEGQTEFLEFLQGNLDVSGIDKDQFSAAVSPQSEVTPALAAKGIKLLKYADPSISYISFNMNDKEVGTPGGARATAIRKAVCACIDREDLIRRYRNGRGEATRQLVPPGTLGYSPANDMPAQTYDPGKGRRILQEAGFQVNEVGRNLYRTTDPATGRQLSMSILLRRNDSQAADYAVFLKSCGDKIGIRIECEPMTFAEFLKRQNEGTGQAYDAGWVMDYPDAQNMLQLLYGPNKPPGINSASYASPEYDRLYREMAILEEITEADRARKAELIRLMHAELEKDCPWVVIQFSKVFSLYHSWYETPEPNAFAYTYIKFIHSDTPARARLATSWSEKPVLPAVIMLLLLGIPMILMGVKILKQAA